MKKDHFLHAAELVELMQREDIMHLFLEDEGVDETTFVETIAPQYVRAVDDALASKEGLLAVGRMIAMGVLQGTAIGILAERNTVRKGESRS